MCCPQDLEDAHALCALRDLDLRLDVSDSPAPMLTFLAASVTGLTRLALHSLSGFDGSAPRLCMVMKGGSCWGRGAVVQIVPACWPTPTRDVVSSNARASCQRLVCDELLRRRWAAAARAVSAAHLSSEEQLGVHAMWGSIHASASLPGRAARSGL